MKYVGIVIEGGVVDGISVFDTEAEALDWAEEAVKFFALDVENGDRDYALFAVNRPTEQLLSNATVEAWLKEAEDEERDEVVEVEQDQTLTLKSCARCGAVEVLCPENPIPAPTCPECGAERSP